MIVDEKMYRRMPRELQALFSCIPNPSRDEVLALFPTTSTSSVSISQEEYQSNNKNKVYGEGMGGGFHPGFGDEGSAARFFYCAKTSGDDRHEGVEENNHPTVKPTALMRYLCRLVTRPGGTVLDCFMGSGSTYKAAYQEGLHFIGIEKEEEYCAIAIKRVAQNCFDFSLDKAQD